MSVHEILLAGAGVFFGYLCRALVVWAGAVVREGRRGPRVIAGVPLPDPSDPRWREATKRRVVVLRSNGLVLDPQEVPVLRLGCLCVEEGEGRLYVLREDGSAGEALPGADGYALQVIRGRQARRALESIAREE